MSVSEERIDRTRHGKTLSPCFEIEVSSYNGHLETCSGWFRLLAGPEGQPRMAVYRQQETALQQAKEVAETANEATPQRRADLSHALRSPLHVMIGYSEILREGIADQSLDDCSEQRVKIHR